MTVSTGLRHRWTAEETAQILELTGDMPWALVPLHYNRWAKQNDRPRRTAASLRLRVDACGGTLTAVGSWLTTGAIARAFDLHASVPNYWTHRWPDILQPFQPPARPNAARAGRIYIRRDRLRAFARRHPEQLGGIPESALAMILEDERLAARIAAAHPQRPLTLGDQPRPVLCVETGQRFPSRTAAGRAHHISPSAIGDAIHGRRPTAAGLHWQDAEVAA